MIISETQKPALQTQSGLNEHLLLFALFLEFQAGNKMTWLNLTKMRNILAAFLRCKLAASMECTAAGRFDGR